jgi:hypothetical protein
MVQVRDFLNSPIRRFQTAAELLVRRKPSRSACDDAQIPLVHLRESRDPGGSLVGRGLPVSMLHLPLAPQHGYVGMDARGCEHMGADRLDQRVSGTAAAPAQ